MHSAVHPCDFSVGMRRSMRLFKPFAPRPALLALSCAFIHLCAPLRVLSPPFCCGLGAWLPCPTPRTVPVLFSPTGGPFLLAVEHPCAWRHRPALGCSTASRKGSPVEACCIGTVRGAGQGCQAPNPSTISRLPLLPCCFLHHSVRLAQVCCWRRCASTLWRHATR